MIKTCKNAKNYKGIRYPQCDRGDGEPCAACLKIWLERNSAATSKDRAAARKECISNE